MLYVIRKNPVVAVMAVALCLVAGTQAQARTYVHPDNLYSFEYPEDWEVRSTTLTVAIRPSGAGHGAFCISRAESSPGVKGQAVEPVIDTLVKKQVMVAAVKAGNPDAENFQVMPYPVANTLTQKILYESGTGDAQARSAMVFGYNNLTGHTVDITCTASADAWDPVYAGDFERIQSSLLMLDGTPEAVSRDPDVLGIRNAIVTEYVDHVRGNITGLRLPDGAFVPAETPDELNRDIIPLEDARRVVNRGVITALAEHCKMDWEKRSFLPFMTQERASRRWTDRQLAFIGGLHGLTQGRILEEFRKEGPCDINDRNRADTLLRTIAARP